jgi:hypothetical protein
MLFDRDDVGFFAISVLPPYAWRAPSWFAKLARRLNHPAERGTRSMPRPSRVRRRATAHRGTERCPETTVEESAANKMGIGLIVQRSDRPVGMLPAS